jgi:hypothetical protein
VVGAASVAAAVGQVVYGLPGLVMLENGTLLWLQ